MPAESDIERRDRALITMAILTGARDGALATLRLKHVDLERKLVMQDPREVRTKRSKRIDTFLFPLGEDLEAIALDWLRYLREGKLFGNDAPLFPRTGVRPDEDGSFIAVGRNRYSGKIRSPYAGSSERPSQRQASLTSDRTRSATR